MQLMLRALCAAAVLAVLAPAAEAYPQFQLATGNSRCSDCHYAPTGGGLINAWGRMESADTISLTGGSGEWLYGAYDEPDWVKLGIDARAVAAIKDQAADPDTLLFPMQGDVYARFQWDALSVYVQAGLRAQARGERPDVLSRFSSREHYAMYAPRGEDYYVRAGRFLVPYGLRTQDHTWYIRRDLGLEVFSETYNLSGGYAKGDWEVHATAFAPAPDVLEAAGPRESGGAALYERRLLDDTAVVAAQTKVGFADDHARYVAGGYGKYWWEAASLLVMGELDLGYETFDADPGPSRAQLVSHLGVTWFPTQGLMVTGAHERYDEDVEVDGTARDGFSLTLQLFPRAKWEILAIGKIELHGSRDRRSTLGMLQLHYYL